jgi:hypothetical protein
MDKKKYRDRKKEIQKKKKYRDTWRRYIHDVSMERKERSTVKREREK